uniref:Uncharacterized protein n=1 Tax=Rhizophora mucronata TaxID=61149 RepID=A0A2P2P7N0_RHIMU
MIFRTVLKFRGCLICCSCNQALNTWP